VAVAPILGREPRQVEDPAQVGGTRELLDKVDVTGRLGDLRGWSFALRWIGQPGHRAHGPIIAATYGRVKYMGVEHDHVARPGLEGDSGKRPDVFGRVRLLYRGNDHFLVLRREPRFRQPGGGAVRKRDHPESSGLWSHGIQVNRELDTVSAPAIGVPMGVANVTIGIHGEQDEVDPAELTGRFAKAPITGQLSKCRDRRSHHWDPVPLGAIKFVAHIGICHRLIELSPKVLDFFWSQPVPEDQEPPCPEISNLFFSKHFRLSLFWPAVLLQPSSRSSLAPEALLTGGRGRHRGAKNCYVAVRGQAEQAVANLMVALEASGARAEDVVKTTVYVASQDRADLQVAWDVVRSRFGQHDAPSTLLGVSVLGWPGQLVEVEAIGALS
jgi:Endoribonuclease L-PSP